MPTSPQELGLIKDLTDHQVEIYAARQHGIETAQEVDGAFQRRKGRNGLRASLADEALDSAAALLHVQLVPVPGGGRYFVTFDDITERHFRIRTYDRSGGDVVVLTDSERGLQAIGEGPRPDQTTLIDIEFWMYGVRYKHRDLWEVTVARQVGTEQYGKKWRPIFTDEMILHHGTGEISGSFRPRHDEDPWGDEGAADGDDS